MLLLLSNSDMMLCHVVMSHVSKVKRKDYRLDYYDESRFGEYTSGGYEQKET